MGKIKKLRTHSSSSYFARFCRMSAIFIMSIGLFKFDFREEEMTFSTLPTNL